MKKNKPSNNVTVFFKDNKLILLLLALFFLIKIFFITTRYHLPIWDESVYMGMGKYIYSQGAAGLWEMIRPFGLPIFAGLMWVLGFDQIYATQILAIIFSCATLFMTYMIAKELFGKKIALLSTFLLAISPVFFLYSIYVLTEIPSTLFILISLYFYLKRRYVLSGVFTGVALLFRFPQGLILVPIALTIFLDWFLEQYPERKQKRKSGRESRTNNTDIKIMIKGLEFGSLIKRMSFYLIGFAIIFIPFITLNYVMYNAYTGNITDALFRPLILAAPHQGNVFESIRGNTLGAQLYNIFYYIVMMLKNNILFILSLVAAIMLLFKFRERAKVLSITLIIYLAYYSYIINKQERFIMSFLPIICILTAYFIFYVIKKIIPESVKQIKDYKNLSDLMRKSSLVSIIIIAVLITSVYAMIIDTQYYYWLHQNDNKPEIIDKYYKVINDLKTQGKIQGSILISDPVLGAFTDNKLIEYAYYDNSIHISNEWESDDNIAAVEYSYDTISCLEEDAQCKDSRESLLNYFSSNYDLYYKGEFYGSERYIFLKRS
jgi:hypothetical protein